MKAYVIALPLIREGDDRIKKEKIRFTKTLSRDRRRVRPVIL